ncbi:serine/threonine-protein kinase Stk1 [Pseudomonas hunanensis]|uniref:Serine/threonine-protein kinase Stk1 n=1 Tax=Pseudomonas hunanensis TaxID=1247546 RepID=A0ACC6JZ33_9PSED|nr:serine/threonine-protein kinase [Pseudomonas hunanensis]MDR6711428.1 serine/threonine-protein kinase Stk1 [Pseudomonas hunanensis]
MTRHRSAFDNSPGSEGASAELSSPAFAEAKVASPCAAPEVVDKRRKRSKSRPQSQPRTPAGELPQLLASRYRIERLLGAGGMGLVYRARDLLHEQFGEPDPYLALKVLRDEFSDTPDASALLYSEFALARHLRHPNIVRLHSFEVDTQFQRAFITMELMRGLTLDKLLCERPTGLTWQELRKVVVPLLDTLAYCHAKGVLHGDLKPSNVMVCEEGVRLFDFGLSQAEQGVLPGLPQLNRGRFNAWTPGYAAPQVLEGGALTVGSDMYAVACVIYELACGEHPFKRLPSTQARDERLDHGLRAPGQLPRHCWPALRAALTFAPSAPLITASQLRDAFSKPAFSVKRWLFRQRG